MTSGVLLGALESFLWGMVSVLLIVPLPVNNVVSTRRYTEFWW